MNITAVLGERPAQNLAALSFQKHAKSCFNAGMVRQVPEPNTLLEQIVDLEKVHKDYLAILASDWIYSAYNTSEREIVLNGKITDKVNAPAMSAPLQTAILTVSSEIELEVSKCKVINYLVAGAGLACQELFLLRSAQLEEVSSELPKHYRRLLLAAERIYWESNPDFLIATDSKALRAGNFKLEPTTSGIPCVTAEALIFPILLNELAQGVMRSIAETGLPKAPLIREYVLNKACDVENSIEAAQYGKAMYLALTSYLCKNSPNARLAEQLACLVQLPAEQFLDQVIRSINNTKLQK